MRLYSYVFLILHLSTATSWNTWICQKAGWRSNLNSKQIFLSIQRGIEFAATAVSKGNETPRIIDETVNALEGFRPMRVKPFVYKSYLTWHCLK